MVFNTTYPYNLSALQQSTTVVSLADYVNMVTNGLFFQAFMIGLFFIMLLAFRRFGIERAIATAGFLCFIISIFLLSLKFIGIIYPISFGVLMLLSLLYIQVNNL